MEALSNQIINIINETKTNTKDKYQEINLKAIQTSNNEQIDVNMAINLSNLESTELIEILKQNKKLLKDFFKFGLHTQLNSKILTEVLKTFTISSLDLESILEYIIELKDLNLLYFFLNKNVDNFTEKEIILSLDFILSEKETEFKLSRDISENSHYIAHGGDIQVSLISILLRNFVDKKYFFSLLKKDKTNKLFHAEHSIMLFQIVKKIYHLNHKEEDNLILNNIENYLLVLSDLLMLALLNKQIEQEQFDTQKNELIEIVEEIKLKKMSITKPQDDVTLMLQFYRNSNRDDFLIEKIKI